MATLTELFAKVKSLSDGVPTDINMGAWFNQCQATLVDILYLPTIATLSKNIDGFYTIPDDCNGELRILEVDSVKIADMPEPVETFDMDNGYIEFENIADTATIKVFYNKLPTVINYATPTQVPDAIHAMFHDIYVIYACMQLMHPEEEGVRYAQFREDYERIKKQIKTYLGKRRPKPSRWGVVR